MIVVFLKLAGDHPSGWPLSELGPFPFAGWGEMVRTWFFEGTTCWEKPFGMCHWSYCWLEHLDVYLKCESRWCVQAHQRYLEAKQDGSKESAMLWDNQIKAAFRKTGAVSNSLKNRGLSAKISESTTHEQSGYQGPSFWDITIFYSYFLILSSQLSHRTDLGGHLSENQRRPVPVETFWWDCTSGWVIGTTNL